MEAEELVRRFLTQVVGEDDPPAGLREGLRETAERVVRAWQYEWGIGYDWTEKDAYSILKTFNDGAEGCGDEIVLVSNIPVYSHCEHHLAPFWGLAHVGYLPNEKIVGLSKFARLVDVYARRLQVQERMTNLVADAVHTALDPRGVGVIVECRHFCMESRGVHARGSITTTSALRGHFKTLPSLRNEFMQLVMNASSTKNGL